ncbi:MAG: radical SAM protein [Candidatus Melainabacteria bacterium GWF2_37_15]|nr:MAG: radical SAM protein [Candidatus Melainabacteria bacterium GWF2_37_15]
MNTKIKPNYDTNRKNLADIIPLPAPFTVYIEQTRFCNFKCFYCIHSTRDQENGEFKKLNYEIKHMNFDMCSKVVEQLAEFPKNSIKRIVFSGLGEPLANPILPELVKLVADKKIAERIEIITNGVLLTPELIDKLINAGLTNINISIQGLSSEKYEEICGKKIDFDKFLENLKYLYENKKNTQIYIKAIDATFENKEEENKFYEIFSPFADKIFIEHLIQMQRQMSKLQSKVDTTKNFYGEEVDQTRQVCSPVFYFLQIGCDLDVFPCPVPGLTRRISLGNIKDNTILEIWNGDKRKNFLKTMLKMQKNIIPDCKGCTNYNCIVDPLEYLDKDAAKLINLFE